MNFEKVDCIVCKSNKYEELLFKSNYKDDRHDLEFNVVRCKRCDLVYINPRPTKKDIISFYPKDYYDNAFLKQNDKIKVCIQNLVDREKFSFFKKFLNKKDEVKKLLDVGCGDGRFLNFIKKGIDVYGVEVSKFGVKNAIEKYKLKNIFNGELKDAKYPSNFFDVITLWTSLEHLHNPILLLKEAKRILKDNGILVLSIPNSRSLQFRIFKEKWFHLDSPRHLYIFSPKSFKKICNSLNLKILKTFNNNIQLNPPGWVASIFGSKNKFINFIFPLLSILFLPISYLEGLFYGGGIITTIIKNET